MSLFQRLRFSCSFTASPVALASMRPSNGRPSASTVTVPPKKRLQRTPACPGPTLMIMLGARETNRARSTRTPMMMEKECTSTNPVRRRHRPGDGSLDVVIPDKSPFVHLHETIGVTEVLVVVRHDDDRSALLVEQGKNLLVELLPEGRGLIGGHFIEDTDGTVLQQAHEQSQTLLLAA